MKTITDVVRQLNGVWPDDNFSDSMSMIVTGLSQHFTVTRDQFEQEAARLRDKPSFADHPDAKCFVQSASGDWSKNVKTAKVIPHDGPGFWGIGEPVEGGSGWKHIGKGEVLGDWRDTLEARPEPMETIKDWADKVEPEHIDCKIICTDVHNAFNPKPWNGEGLPPVGVDVTHTDEKGFSAIVRIIAHAKNPDTGIPLAIFFNKVEGIGGSRAEFFEPIKSERERVMEAALAVYCEPNLGMLSRQEFCERLYDCGMLKLSEVDGE
jgi:hypothetical protein